jgi:hypothetical protein
MSETNGPKMLIRLLNWLFACEEINGATRCPTYLYRWRLLRWRSTGVAIYLHRFVRDDWSLDLHDHPKRFVSIGLAGSYIEHTPKRARLWSAPWLRSFPAEHIHRITLGPCRECWTLVIVFSAVRPWGFIHDGVWVPWKEYVQGRFAGADDAWKSCAD